MKLQTLIFGIFSSNFLFTIAEAIIIVNSAAESKNHFQNRYPNNDDFYSKIQRNNYIELAD